MQFWSKSLISTGLVAAMLLTACGEEDRPSDEGKKSAGTAKPSIQQQTDTFLQEFAADSATAMEKIPPKWNNQGQQVQTEQIPFLQGQAKTWLQDKTYIDIKDMYRKGVENSAIIKGICDENEEVCVKDLSETTSFAEAKNSIYDILDTSELPGRRILNTLEEMEAQRLTAARLAETPWSDSYWPIYMGVLGARYADRNFMNSAGTLQWKGYYNWIISRGNLRDSIRVMSEDEIANLSPAEKYDLLIGVDYNSYDASDILRNNGFNLNGEDKQLGVFTNQQWKQGAQYYRDGKVETWMGICHGWAAAAYMMVRPKKTIRTPIRGNASKKIKWYPSDLKGLGNYTWANSAPRSRFIGGRCNDKDPDKYPSGRIKSEACFDVNPANWHLAVVNQIGRAKRSIVLDVTYDYEVWNQPIYRYKYSYFNPQSLQRVASLRDAKVNMRNFTNDKFPQPGRSRSAEWVVGIAMEVEYVVENDPSHDPVDSPDKDLTHTVTYFYDLELNRNNEIVGGEWYSNKHPDFLWSPVKNSRASTSDEGWQLFEDEHRAGLAWNPSRQLPPMWADIAIVTAKATGETVAVVVEKMMAASNQAQ